MPAIDAPQRSEEWFAARAGKITASLAAACLGLDPYNSRAKAWREITGVQYGNRTENKAQAWGREFEGRARAEYEDLSGELAFETGFWTHPAVAWLGASPDGLIGEDGLLEVKCPGSLPETIPLHHRIQMQIQLAVTERKWCDYFSWTHKGYWLRRVYPAGIAGLIRRLAAFREQFVVPNLEPPRKVPKRRKVHARTR